MRIIERQLSAPLGIYITIMLFLLPACAQTQTILQKSQAFYTIKLPGNIMVDESGQPVNAGPRIERILYIEVSSKLQPQVEAVLYNGVTYNASIFLEDQSPVTIGKLKTNGKTVLFQPRKGNRIWRIEVGEPTNGNAVIKQNEVKKIEIRGNANGKRFSNIIMKETELQTFDAY
jgi:hypothetical protein